MKTDKNKNSVKISMIKLLAEIISSRDIADVLENVIKKVDAESVVLDFTNIKFVSRSAAHSLLLLRERLESRLSNRKEISFENAPNDVSEMLRVVSANRTYPKSEKPTFNPEKIDITSLLKETV